MIGDSSPVDGRATPALNAKESRQTGAFAALWSGGAVLTSIALGLLASLPDLESDSIPVSQWIEDGRFALTWSGEVLFFAVIAWATGAAGTVVSRGRGSPIRRVLSLTGLGVALVAFVIALLALGRLVYPIVDVDLGSDTLVLVVSVVTGSIHLALLGLAICAASFPFPARSAGARWTAGMAGLLVGVAFVLGSYPWVLPAWFNIAVAALVGAWGILTGLAITRGLDSARDRVASGGCK